MQERPRAMNSLNSGRPAPNTQFPYPIRLALDDQLDLALELSVELRLGEFGVKIVCVHRLTATPERWKIEPNGQNHHNAIQDAREK